MVIAPFAVLSSAIVVPLSKQYFSVLLLFHLRIAEEFIKVSIWCVVFLKRFVFSHLIFHVVMLISFLF